MSTDITIDVELAGEVGRDAFGPVVEATMPTEDIFADVILESPDDADEESD